jgi:hypothetical protein
MVILERDHEALAGIEASPELLFQEAKQRRRRRWLKGGLLGLPLALGLALLIVVASQYRSPSASLGGTRVPPAADGRGTIAGILELQTNCRICFPRKGTVTATSHGRSYKVSVPQNGLFSLKVPAGRYVVTGRSPHAWSVVRPGVWTETPCTTGLPPIEVKAEASVPVALECVTRLPPGPVHVRFFPRST